jgi:2-octaprenyl-6-methoxyphenol hydroxylase|tara:strand:+ start:3803 stop:4951 length:1149 start_codon:yes stop_codon:yes gene_type:complete
MKKQKICIIGDGLAGLTTALSLIDLPLSIDLFHRKQSIKKNHKQDKRTTAISNSNYRFIKQITNIKDKNIFWSCKKIKLFYQNEKEYLNFLNYDDSNYLMHIVENFKLKKLFLKNLATRKNIRLIKEPVKKISSKESCIILKNKKFFYDMIILCLGNNSPFYEEILGQRSISNNSEEEAVTTSVKHNMLINYPSQYFLKEGPLAILPYNKNNFSLVWSLNKKFLIDNEKNLKNLLNEKLKYLIGKKTKIHFDKLMKFPIYLNLKKKYYKNNTVVLGEGIHVIHPIAGQGFNLVLRDIEKLTKLIKRNLELGLEIRDSFILEDFSNSRKPENNLFGLCVDLTNKFFKYNKLTSPIKNMLLKNISNNKIIKRYSKSISDSGFFS